SRNPNRFRASGCSGAALEIQNRTNAFAAADCGTVPGQWMCLKRILILRRNQDRFSATNRFLEAFRCGESRRIFTSRRKKRGLNLGIAVSLAPTPLVGVCRSVAF